MSLALDASPTTFVNNVNATSKTIGLTTSGTDRICLLFACIEHPTTTPVITSVTSSGLTWVKRKDVQATGDNGPYSLEEWWAYAAAQQTAATVTVNFSANCDNAALCTVGVSGVPASRFTNPWDSNVSLPNTHLFNATGDQTITGNSTTNADTMMFMIAGDTERHAAPSTVSGPVGTSWTQDANLFTAAGTIWVEMIVNHHIFSAAQSSISITAATSLDAKTSMIVDAISGDALSTGFKHSFAGGTIGA